MRFLFSGLFTLFLFLTFNSDAREWQLYRSQRYFIQNIFSEISHEKPSTILGKKGGLSSTLLPNINILSRSELTKKGYIFKKVKTAEGHESFYYIGNGSRGDGEYVAAVSGLSATAETASNRKYAMPLRKYYGYGVLLLENVTSKEWGLRNNRTILTGFEAGMDLYLRLKEIRRTHPEIKKLHLLGTSLGGSDSVFAAAIDQNFVEIGRRRVIDGAIVNFSSPLDRAQAMADIPYKKDGGKLILNILFKNFYQGNKSRLTKYGQYSMKDIFFTKDQKSIQENVFIPLLADSMKRFPKSFSPSFMNKDDFFSMSYGNQYEYLNSIEFFMDRIRVPILWINSKNDDIVGYKTTYNTLVQKRNNNALMDMILVPYGGHLGFAHTYGKTWIRKTLDAYFAYWR